jgi:hypothetical protein
MTTHEYVTPLQSDITGFMSPENDEPLSFDYVRYSVSIRFRDEDGNMKSQNIQVCEEYLKNMARFISGIWQLITDQFNNDVGAQHAVPLR